MNFYVHMKGETQYYTNSLYLFLKESDSNAEEKFRLTNVETALIQKL